MKIIPSDIFDFFLFWLYSQLLFIPTAEKRKHSAIPTLQSKWIKINESTVSVNLEIFNNVDLEWNWGILEILEIKHVEYFSE